MFNKIKNFFNRSKKAIDNKCNEIYCKAQTAVANAKAEFYIDKTVGIIICVVVGVTFLSHSDCFESVNGGLNLFYSAFQLHNRAVKFFAAFGYVVAVSVTANRDSRTAKLVDHFADHRSLTAKPFF